MLQPQVENVEHHEAESPNDRHQRRDDSMPVLSVYRQAVAKVLKVGERDAKESCHVKERGNG